MQIGSKVRYIGPSLFAGGARWEGTVVRLPLSLPGSPRRLSDGMALVQVGDDPRPRPVRLSDLQELPNG